jgi:3-deoxy-D-manno-octulosonate 8-phosphate phosphatase (KDO 8-P phosphatase)
VSEQWPLPEPAEALREVEERCGAELTGRLAAVGLLVLDCDGVMTDGRLYFGPSGEALKAFDARDGLGLMMLHAAGIARAVLTGRRSAMVARRCEELRFEAIKMARFDKMAALAEIQRETGVPPERTLYLGDDLLDLPTLAAAGVAVTVPGAPDEVKAACDLTTRAAGGRGAVREVCDLLLKARGAHAEAIGTLAAGAREADDPEVTH